MTRTNLKPRAKAAPKIRPAVNTAQLEKIAKEDGMAVFGVAELSPIQATFRHEILQAAHEMIFGVVMGYRLSDPVIDDIVDGPTLLYKHHYKVANYMLDRAACHVAARINAAGYKALPIPASQMIDWLDYYGHLSHKAVATQAGLGWIGRSALFIHPEHRGRLRLVSVLTDMPLVPGRPLPKQDHCGRCRLCIVSCPAGAITEDGYDRHKCADKLKEFSKQPGIGQNICGLCVKVCR